MCPSDERPVRFDADRKSELRQRLASHLALQTPAGLPRPTWRDALTPDQMHGLIEKIRHTETHVQ